MGLLVFLLGSEHPRADVGPGVADELAALGITTLSVLRDEQTTALAVEGWAFDVARSADAAARVIAADGRALRVLRPVLQSELHRYPDPEGSSERKGIR